MNEIAIKPDALDPFGLRKCDFTKRIPEKSEMFSPEEAQTYIDGCDFPESADDLMLAWEIKELFRDRDLKNKSIMDAMCGPGRLGRELLNLGARDVVFQDGDRIMLSHAQTKAKEVQKPGQTIRIVQSLVDAIPIPDNSFDMVVCHNSTHQLSSVEKLGKVLKEFLRVTKPGGRIFIADFQRNTSPKFLAALEERLVWTKPEIVPLLVPTFMAAFSRSEFNKALELTGSTNSWDIWDAKLPTMTPVMRKRADLDPVKGHMLDFSPISIRVMASKGWWPF